jgi:ABC-type sugar transport system substrate-binding protein
LSKAVAEHTANRLGLEVEIVYAENDAVLQNQQLLRIIQSSTSLIAGIIFEPVGATGLPQVAKAAVAFRICGAVIVSPSSQSDLTMRKSKS